MEIINFLPITFARQCGDVFLFETICPICNNKTFQSFPFGCCVCGESLLEYRAELSPVFNFKVVCGTERKRRLGKRKIQELMSLQENQCAYCDLPLPMNFHVEHIMPLCCGGSNNMSNLALSCPRCNHIAGSKWFHSYYDKKLYILSQRTKKKDFVIVEDTKNETDQK